MPDYFIRLLVIMTLCALTGADCNKQTELTPVEKNGKWGYTDRNGKWVIQPRYVLALDFLPTGIAAVVDDSGWVYIDKKGDLVIRPFLFDNGPDYFSEGLARFTVNNRFGFFDEYGKIVIQPRFDFARPFSGGFAAVCEGGENRRDGEHSYRHGGKWGFINKTGKIIIPLQYDQVKNFSEGQAQVRGGEEWKTINEKGE